MGLCIVLVAAALARMMMTYVQDHPVKTSPTISCTTTRVEKVGVHDLIIGEPHQKVEFSYDITNPTDSSLTFDKPRLFCACALTVTPKTVLEPGESTRLAFSLQAPMAGTRRETLVLPYDNGAIVIRVAVAADVAPPTVTQTPGLVSLDLVRGAVT